MKVIKVLENCTIDGNRYAKGTINFILISDELVQKLIEDKLIEDVLSQVGIQGEVDLSNYVTIGTFKQLDDWVYGLEDRIFDNKKDIFNIRYDISSLKTGVEDVNELINGVNEVIYGNLMGEFIEIENRIGVLIEELQNNITALELDMMAVKEKLELSE